MCGRAHSGSLSSGIEITIAFMDSDLIRHIGHADLIRASIDGLVGEDPE